MARSDPENILVRSYGSHMQPSNSAILNQENLSTPGHDAEDSELLIPDGLKRGKLSWIQNEQLREHIKPFLASIALTMLGCVCVLVGISVTIWPAGIHGWVFLIVGCVCLIPGAYHLIYIIFILRGREGYTWDSLRAFS